MISTVAPCSPASGSLWRICFCKEPRTEYPRSACLISVPAARSTLLTRMAVILHERLGTWSAQLRPRLQGRPVHWIETRSATDLDKALLGLACPVVLIDLKRNVVKGLSDLDRSMRLFPGTRVLVLDPEAHDGVAEHDDGHATGPRGMAPDHCRRSRPGFRLTGVTSDNTFTHWPFVTCPADRAGRFLPLFSRSGRFPRPLGHSSIGWLAPMRRFVISGGRGSCRAPDDSGSAEASPSRNRAGCLATDHEPFMNSTRPRGR